MRSREIVRWPVWPVLVLVGLGIYNAVMQMRGWDEEAEAALRAAARPNPDPCFVTGPTLADLVEAIGETSLDEAIDAGTVTKPNHEGGSRKRWTQNDPAWRAARELEPGKGVPLRGEERFEPPARRGQALIVKRRQASIPPP